MANQRIRRSASLLPLLGLVAALAACDVELGDAEFALERPPTPDDTATAAETEEAPVTPVPDPPLLYRVRADEGGRARLTPVALVRDDGLESLPLPADAPEGWWSRFDSTFLVPGRELAFLADGVRLGTVVLTGLSEPSGPRCPGTAGGQLLVLPGTASPESGFAAPSSAVPGGSPAASVAPGTTGRHRTFGPILAERLLQEAGVERHYLAREADLQGVALDDSTPGFAATYLIADSLAPGPPSGQAVSLFFLARYEPQEGFVPDWSLLERYETAGGKAAYRYLESIPLAAGRVDVLLRYGGTGSPMAAAWVADGSRRIGWSAAPDCPVE